jgi:type II secretory pathway component GspD/PulD (secretin)
MVKRQISGHWACWGRALVGLALLAIVGTAMAQEAPAIRPGRMSPEQLKAMEAAKAQAAAAQAAAQSGAQPAQPKPEEKEKKPEGEGEKKKEETSATIERPEKPPKPPDPRELEVSLDDKGRVPPFNFVGQPWPDVLQWLANMSKCSFDWQKLPNDYLNLTTQRSYTLDEVHDLINRHLHARGFTSVIAGDVLSVFEIAKLDPSLVPRVTEDELYDLKAYDYVKVSFQLPEGMEVDKAKEDIKQALSTNAKVFPLVTSKRLLVMDAVANLRGVSEDLNQERIFQNSLVVPTEFVLKHARPEEVIEMLYVLLGVDPKAKPAQTDPQVQQQQMQMMQQMQQQGKDVSKMLQRDAPKVHLVYNRRRNSILANASPSDLKKIEQAIKSLDVPYGGGEAMVDVAVDDSGERTLFKYQLVTMDPEELKLTLEQIGELDPRTHLRADTKSKILFARATADDHKKIAALKDELDGSGRGLHQIWLPRRLPADAVAGTIYALMSGQEEEEEEQDYPYWYGYRSRNDDDKPKKGFRVDADIENNRLLLWASDAEFKEVEAFIAELSKASPAVEAQRTVRTIEGADPAATARLLEQLRKAWPALGENELIINDERPKTEPAVPKKKTDEEKPKTEDREARLNRPGGPRFQLVQLTTEAPAASPKEAEQATNEPAKAEPARRPPITVTVTEDGRIVIASEDTAALDRIEQFMGQTSPQAQRYKIFKIRYADVYDVYLNLKEYYEEELKGDTKQVWNYWWDQYESVDSKEGSLLTKRPTLRIIWDPASDTILVANASQSQLAEIDRLIKEYDQPQPDDETTERVTRPVKIQYSRASTIVTALKEVFRDLLSSKDKEFDSKDQKSGSGGGGITVLRYSLGGGGTDDGSKKSAPVKVGFQGALSLAADDVSNIVLVSAQTEVFKLVEAMIQRLDAEAAPQTTVHVHRLTGNIKAENLQKALDEAVGKAWLGNRPEQTGTSGEQDKKQDGDRDGDRDRGDRRGRNRDRDND